MIRLRFRVKVKVETECSACEALMSWPGGARAAGVAR
jgi:hypothetical protein